MKEVSIYVEGGGDTTAGKALLRVGFDALLAEQKELARKRQVRWKLVACGGRESAIEAFSDATDKADSSNLVAALVDAEEHISEATSRNHVEHIAKRAGWSIRSPLLRNVHLMTACMEAWLVADPEMLAAYYGQGFRAAALSKRTMLDEEPKDSLAKGLKAATRDTRKGSYSKLKHGSDLLHRVRPAKLVARCASFKLFTDWLSNAISPPSESMDQPEESSDAESVEHAEERRLPSR